MLTTRINIILSILVIITISGGYGIVRFAHIEDTLLPHQNSIHPWRASAGADVEDGGGSSVDLRDSTYSINLDFNLTNAIPYPYVTLGLYFDAESNPKNLEDWSSYSSMMLRIKCRPANVLNLAILTYDDAVTKFSADIRTFRPSLAFVSCGEEWQTVRIDLAHLEAAEWWLQRYNLSLANRDYSLDKVRGIALSTSTQSIKNIPSNIIIQELSLERRNLPVIYTLSSLISLLWIGFVGWSIYRFYLLRRTIEVIHDVTPMVYQAVPIEPRCKREKEAVLDYMASKYSLPELSMDMAVNELGINRIKINEILREETGLTFTTYLNKLRLSEAARLLSNRKVGVAEAAFAVGYNSLSYFNRLFKKEYGCNPSSYKGPAPILNSPLGT
jgi:AraC-like DNA-binding protein